MGSQIDIVGVKNGNSEVFTTLACCSGITAPLLQCVELGA